MIFHFSTNEVYLCSLFSKRTWNEEKGIELGRRKTWKIASDAYVREVSTLLTPFPSGKHWDDSVFYYLILLTSSYNLIISYRLVI